MTDKEKLEKLKKLADAMYYAAQQLTTDASRLHKAMDEYHKFIIRECKKEPKECMYSKDNYTDEDRKVLCEGCEEECEFKPTTSVWHDASEMPKEGSWICVSYASRDLSTFLYEDGKIHNNYVDTEMIGCKWAYPENLLKL